MTPPADEFSAQDLASLADEMHSLWHAVIRRMQASGQHEVAVGQQNWVLGHLVNGPRRMSELAERAGTSQASLTGIADRLEERGLVQRRRSSEDRRVVEVELTPAGLDEAGRVRERLLASLDGVLAPLSTVERRHLLDLLRTITSHQPAASHPATGHQPTSSEPAASEPAGGHPAPPADRPARAPRAR